VVVRLLRAQLDGLVDLLTQKNTERCHGGDLVQRPHDGDAGLTTAVATNSVVASQGGSVPPRHPARRCLCRRAPCVLHARLPYLAPKLKVKEELSTPTRRRNRTCGIIVSESRQSVPVMHLSKLEPKKGEVDCGEPPLAPYLRQQTPIRHR
jgi:hypothetical protein